ncbi:MAG: adenylate/guanylate cyclase domain-containing protein [Spirochaetota bacterium]
MKEFPKEFQEKFSEIVVHNERNRMKIVLLIIVSISAFFSLNRFFLLNTQNPNFRVLKEIYPSVMLFFLFMMTYESVLIYILYRFSLSKKQPPEILRYGNAFLEVSLPSAVIFVFAKYASPMNALYSPPTYIYFLFIFLAVLRLSFPLCLFTGTVASIQYFFIYFLHEEQLRNFSGESIYEPTILLMKGGLYFTAGLVAGYISQQIRLSFIESIQNLRKKDQIESVFGEHVSPQVVETLLEPGKSSSELQHVCILFLDIRNFTAYSEKESPVKVVDLLNQTFSFMVPIIQKHQGIINKFLGDGFMAIFGAPIATENPEKEAVIASLELLQELQSRIASGELENISVGIGIHSGDAVTGTIGSQKRKEYTIIGDVVNLAARIEQLNKQYQSSLLVSEEVYLSLQTTSYKNIPAEEIAETYVKGKEKPVRLYKLA